MSGSSSNQPVRGFWLRPKTHLNRPTAHKFAPRGGANDFA